MRTKTLTAIAAALISLALSAPPAAAAANPLSIYRYVYNPAACGGARPSSIANSAYQNTGSNFNMRLAGDVTVCTTSGSYDTIKDLYFTEHGPNRYAIGYALPTLSSTQFVANVPAGMALSLATQFVYTDEYHHTGKGDYTPNVAQVGRASNSGTDTTCSGPGNRCFGMLKITLMDPGSGTTNYLQCVAEAGTTADHVMKVKDNTKNARLIVGHTYLAACQKFGDGPHSTELKLIVHDLTAGTTTTADGFSSVALGPLRTKKAVSEGNHWPLESTPSLDQFTALIEGLNVCQQDAAHTAADTEACAEAGF